MLDWSPDQISGYLHKENIASISHERIYQFLIADKKVGGALYTHLRHSGKKRKNAMDQRINAVKSKIAYLLMKDQRSLIGS